MDYREIGKTGIRVYPIGFGVLHLSTAGRPDEDTGSAVIKAALDAGVTLLDTANSYCRDNEDFGHNERLINKTLGQLGRWNEVTLATKGGTRRPGGAWTLEGNPESLRTACEQSLRELGLDCITLYYFHWPDPAVPYADSIGALARLQEEGKIQHIGVSNVTRELLQEAMAIVRVEAVQNKFNLSEREDLDSGLIAECGRQGISYIPYSPVGGAAGHRGLTQNPVLAPIAKNHGVSPYQIILAWMLHLGDHVLPIPGASKASSITDSAQAAGLSLSPVEVARLSKL